MVLFLSCRFARYVWRGCSLLEPTHFWRNDQEPLDTTSSLNCYGLQHRTCDLSFNNMVYDLVPLFLSRMNQ